MSFNLLILLRHAVYCFPLQKVATAPGSRSRVPPAASANLGFNDKYDATVDIPLDTLNVMKLNLPMCFRFLGILLRVELFCHLFCMLFTQDSNKKEKELAAWEADLKRKEKVTDTS